MNWVKVSAATLTHCKVNGNSSSQCWCCKQSLYCVAYLRPSTNSSAQYQLARIRATSNKERQVQSPVTIFCNLAIALSPTGYHAVRCDHANRPGTQRCSDTECDFQANRPAERECFIGNSSCVRHVLPLIIARGYVNAHLVGPASAHTNHRPTNHTKTVDGLVRVRLHVHFHY